jgi:hypothetical protein
MTSAIGIHTHLLELQAERALASIEGLAVNSAYTADLDGEIEATTTVCQINLATRYPGDRVGSARLSP